MAPSAGRGLGADAWFTQFLDVTSKPSGGNKAIFGNMECAVVIDEHKTGHDVSLKLTRREKTSGHWGRHLLSMRMHANSQAPGFYIGTDLRHIERNASFWRKEQMREDSACFLVSPDLCEDFDLRIVKYEDADQFDSLMKSWSPLVFDTPDAAAGPSYTKLFMIEISIRFKAGMYPVCKKRSPAGEAEGDAAILDALAGASTMKILTHAQTEGVRMQVEWFAHIMQRCTSVHGPDKRSPGTFWMYRDAYRARGFNVDISLPAIIFSAAVNSGLNPPVPVHLLDTQTRTIVDESEAEAKPFIATVCQWITMQMIGALRASTNQSQLRALIQLCNSKPKSGQFHLSRHLIGPPLNEFAISALAEFEDLFIRPNGLKVSTTYRTAVYVEVQRVLQNANNAQNAFINAALNDCILGYLQLTGAPGTGKAWTLAAVAYALVLLGKRVIVCGHSNIAVDALFHQFLSHTSRTESPELKGTLDAIRFYKNDTETRLRQALRDGRAVDQLKSKGMEYPYHSLAAVTRKAIQESGEESLFQVRQCAEFERAMYAEGNVDRAGLADLDESLLQAERAILRKCGVVFVTADALALFLPRETINAEVLLVNQASLVTMAEFNQTLQCNRPYRMVIAAGDLLQGEPRPYSRSGGGSEYGQIFAESPIKAMYLHPKHGFELEENCRNPPFVVDVLRKMGYKNLKFGQDRLPPRINVAEQLRSVRSDPSFLGGALATVELRSPVIFFDAPCPESSIHTAQIDIPGTKICVALVKDLVEKAGIAASDIVVLSSFVPDRDNMAAIFEQRPDAVQLRSIAVHTMDSFRGGECEVVILHMVSASPDAMQYVSRGGRLHVAFTRTRQLLIVVGPWTTLAEASRGRRNASLRHLLDAVRSHRALATPDGRTWAGLMDAASSGRAAERQGRSDANVAAVLADNY